MYKKYFVLFLFIVFLSNITKGESVSYFIKKHNLPANINVLSIFGEDCVNCYYGFSYFLKEHKADFKKENFVFLFQKTAEKEVDNIFKYRLGFEKTGYKIIVDDAFYALLSKNGVSTLSIIEKENETMLLQYDKELKMLLSKKNIFDGYLTDIFIFKNKLFAFENYSAKGDVATLHVYQFK